MVGQVGQVIITTAVAEYGLVGAQIGEPTQPITDQPRNRFKKNMAVVFRFFLATAMIDGSK